MIKRCVAIIMALLMMAGAVVQPEAVYAVDSRMEWQEARNAGDESSKKVVSLSMGFYCSGALTEDGSLYMWGSNGYGQLGDGTTEDRYQPVKVLDHVVSFTTGGSCSAAITEDGSLYTWGYNYYGALGDGTTTDRYEPVKVLENVVSLSTGLACTGAITEDGSLYTWGNNDYGQLGDGTTETRTRPVKVMENVVALNMDGNNGCTGAITEDRSLYMWGWNDEGQLGDGTTEDRYTPVKVLENVKSFVSGGYRCHGAITKDGSLYMWGDNMYGNLGDGTTEDRYYPVKVLDHVVSSTLGWSSSGAITENGSLYMWGLNGNGQLGDGTKEIRHQPVKVLDHVVSLTFDESGCKSGAITEDGSLYMWGFNYYGQLGDGTWDERHQPVKVLDHVASLTFGYFYCSGAVTEDGSLYMWGANKEGELGDGTTETRLSPVKVNIGSSALDPDPSIPDTDITNKVDYLILKDATGTLDSPLSCLGHIYLKDGETATLEQWEQLLEKMSWESSSPDVADVNICKSETDGSQSTYSDIDIRIDIAAKELGTTTLTCSLPNGITESFQVSIVGSVTPDPDPAPDSGFDVDVYHASYIYDFCQRAENGYIEANFNSNTPSQLLCTESVVNRAEAWRNFQDILSTADDPSGVLDRAMEKKDLYQGIIFSLFEAAAEMDIPGEDLVKEAGSLFSTIVTDMNAIYGIQNWENYDMSKMTKEQRKIIRGITQDYFNQKGIVKLSDRIGDVSTVFDMVGSFRDYCEYVSSCVLILQMGESYKTVLQDMYDACPEENNDLRQALKDCVSIMDMNIDQLVSEMQGHAFVVTGKEIIKIGLSKLWDGVKATVITKNAYVALIWASAKTSTCFCDKVWNVSNIAERSVKMAAVLDVRALVRNAYEKEKSSFEDDRIKENAEQYLAAIEVSYQYLDEDCKAADKFVEEVGDTLTGKIQSLFGKNSIDEVNRQIKSIQGSYFDLHEDANRSWLFSLEVENPKEYEKYKYLLDESRNRVKKRYNIACPVDVYVYDASGDVAASIVNNVPYCKENAPFTVAAIDDEKQIWFYGDEGEFSVRYVGTDEGAMDIAIEEYGDDQALSRQVKFTDVPLTEGKEYTSADNLASGQNTYELSEKETGSSLEPTTDTSNTEIPEYTLSIKNGYMVEKGDFGYTGKFYAGEKITVYANVPDGAVWEGWIASVPETVITDKNAKTVTVTMPSKNMELTAVYKTQAEPDMPSSPDTPSLPNVPVKYTITYNLNGGTVSGNPDSYTKDILPVKLKEPTRSGYTFIGWTGSNGNTPQKEVTIEKGSTGVKSYTANWSKNDEPVINPDAPDSNNNSSSNNNNSSSTGNNNNSISNSNSISHCMVTLSEDCYTYDGKAKMPDVMVRDGANVLMPETDYTVSYGNNTDAGTASVTVSGAGGYTGEQTVSFTIRKASNVITAADIKKTASSKTRKLSIGAEDLAHAGLSYKSNHKSVKVSKTGKVTIAKNFIGSAVITITAAETGNYAKAVKKIKVTVKPASVKLTDVKSLNGNKIQVRWKKMVGITGYQIQYSTSKDFKKGTKTVTVPKKMSTSATIAKITKGKKYYVRIRAYKKVSGKTYYSEWSRGKTAVVEK